MLGRWCPLAVALAAGALLAATPPAGAVGEDVAVVDVVNAGGGAQIVVRISGGNAVLVREHPDGRLEIDETGSYPIGYTSAAAGRCERGTDRPRSVVLCKRDGLLTATATRKPLRFEFGPDYGRVRLSDSPYPVEVVGGPQPDNVQGTPFDDIITLGDGNDAANGSAGNDRINLGSGNDEGVGGSGDDRVEGGDGHDLLGGGAGRDLLIGGAGDDLLFAEWLAQSAWASEDVARHPDGYDIETIDEPTDCGPGDDTVSQRSARMDPVLASCEHTLLQPSGDAPLSIQGKLQVGETLTAARPPVGVDPSWRHYVWVSCESIDVTGLGSNCEARSTCSTFRLEARDAGRQVKVIARVVYTLSGGRYKVQPGDEYVYTSLGVGASSAPLGPNDISRYIGAGYSEVYVEGSGIDDRTGGRFVDSVVGDQVCDPVTGPANGTRTDPAGVAPDAGATPGTGTVSPEGKSGSSPAPSTTNVPQGGGVAAPIAASAARQLAGQLAAALGRTTARTLLRKGSLAVAVAPPGSSTIRLQVRRGKRWLNVGVGRTNARKVVIKLGTTGRGRLKAAVRGGRKPELRVLVRARGEQDAVVPATLRR